MPISEHGRVVGGIGVAEDIAGETSVNAAAVSERVESRLARLADQMRQAMESRAVIEQAKGILIGAHGCTPDQAFQMRYARSACYLPLGTAVASDVLSSARTSKSSQLCLAAHGDGKIT
jgi:hypothetical protein